MADEPKVRSPAYWMARAKETRLTAAAMPDAGARRVLREIADQYEKLAAAKSRPGLAARPASRSD
jgi:hypothetical protein